MSSQPFPLHPVHEMKSEHEALDTHNPVDCGGNLLSPQYIKNIKELGWTNLK